MLPDTEALRYQNSVVLAWLLPIDGAAPLVTVALPETPTAVSESFTRAPACWYVTPLDEYVPLLALPEESMAVGPCDSSTR